jgi:hypothetical protein
MAELLRIISLGAGVQSTTMALMAAHGEITPVPDCAIFADTQAEPNAVYEHLRWLMSPNVLPFPVHIVTAGSLRDEIMNGRTGHGRPPLFIKNPDGSKGILKRQCTEDFKIGPIEKKVRELLGLKKGQHWPKTVVVEQWIGISVDEKQRAKLSRRPAIVRRHPLIELGLHRWDCLQWLKRHEIPTVIKSACTFCPFKSPAEWQATRADPPAWKEAITVDAAVRRHKRYTGLVGEVYLHPSLKPLSEVDFTTDKDRGQNDLFPVQESCECGA